jgi:hypothetical protein
MAWLQFKAVEIFRVGGTGIEPVTSSVSGKRSPAELTARDKAWQDYRVGA